MACAAVAAAMRSGLADGRPPLSSPPPHSTRGVSSSTLPRLPLRGSSARGGGLPRAPLPAGALASPRRRPPFSVSASAASAASPVEPPKEPASIWCSDVTPIWKKPYFLNRVWTGCDKWIAIFFIVTHAACLLAPFYFTWKAFGVFLGLYVITGLLGITLSFHRNLAHKSFTLPKWLEYTFALCGSLALQGDPMEWVSSHRFHHQHCDTERDPHSPYGGFWHSHMGWLLDNEVISEKVGARTNVGDMANQPFYRFLRKTYALNGLLLGCALYAWGGLPFFLWGGIVRLVWVYHITWLVNSASHVWGHQAWKTGDLSKNNWWVAILAFGEGWHNNHHAFEYSARHGLEWWQLDLTWYLILALEKLGLATNVKLPTKEHKKRLSFDVLLTA